MNPLISVIIPCYNSAKSITTALDSMLSQTYKNLEIIVVNDNSTDNLKEVIAPYLSGGKNIRLIDSPAEDPYRVNRKGININAGYSARNFGVENAKEEIIVFQDADDASFNDRIEIQYAVMEKYGAMSVVVDWQRFDENCVGKLLNLPVTEKDLTMPDEINRQVARNNPIPGWVRDPYSGHASSNPFVVAVKKLYRLLIWRKNLEPYPCAAGSVMVRKEVFDQIKFRPLWERTRPSKKGRGTDMDFNYAVAEKFGKSIAINLPLYLWRFPSNVNNVKYKDKKYFPCLVE